MPTKPEEDKAFLYADCGHFTVPLWQGRMYLELDQLEEAWNVFSLAQQQQEMPARISTEFLNHLLDTSIFQVDRDKSLFCLEKALNAARDLKSERRLREIREAYERMRLLWRHEQQVKDAMDLFQQSKHKEEPGRL
jgi:tetratricopeptide (TPR) repeat protein